MRTNRHRANQPFRMSICHGERGAVGRSRPWHEAARRKESFSAIEEPRLIEDEMAYLSRLFGSVIWIIRGYYIALQHLVTYM